MRLRAGMAAVVAGFAMSIFLPGAPVSPQSSPPPRAPAPAADCLLAVDFTGEGSWFCGDTVRIPTGWRIEATTMPACASDHGAGAVPCRWDAATQGSHPGGRSFTVLRSRHGTLLNRYDDGVSIEIDEDDVDCWDDASCAATSAGYVLTDPHTTITHGAHAPR